MPRHTWDIKTPRDLLEKATRDLDAFRKAEQEQTEHMVDRALDCAITTWHVVDWEHRDANPHLYASPRSDAANHDLGSYRRRLFGMQHGKCLRYCADVANGSKHMYVDTEKADIATDTSAATVPTSGPSQIELAKRRVLKIVDKESGDRHRARDVLERAIDLLDSQISGRSLPRR